MEPTRSVESTTSLAIPITQLSATNFYGQRVTLKIFELTKVTPPDEKTKNSLVTTYADSFSGYFDIDRLRSFPQLLLNPITWGRLLLEITRGKELRKTQTAMLQFDLNTIPEKPLYLITAHTSAIKEDDGLIGWLVASEKETNKMHIEYFIMKKTGAKIGVHNLLLAALLKQFPTQSITIDLDLDESCNFKELGFEVEEPHVYSSCYKLNDRTTLNNISSALVIS